MCLLPIDPALTGVHNGRYRSFLHSDWARRYCSALTSSYGYLRASSKQGGVCVYYRNNISSKMD